MSTHTIDLSRYTGEINELDFARDAPQITAQQMSAITIQAQQMLDLMDDIADKEDDLLRLKRQLQDLQERELPETMALAGMLEFTHISGRKIQVKDVVAGQPPKNRFEDALAWLRQHSHDGIIKRSISVTVNLPKGNDAIGNKLVAYLRKLKTLQTLGVIPKDEPTIHYMTFGSWAREVRATHIDQHLPTATTSKDCPFCDEQNLLPLLGIYVGKKAEVKEVKK